VVNVKVIGIDEKGRINLSMKALLPRPENRDNNGGNTNLQPKKHSLFNRKKKF
jgi:predicted RNA-binding protein with RPS1 domain